MNLGKITFRVERINSSWLYCRPVSYADGSQFQNIIGVCHVVYIKKGLMTEDMVRGGIYTTYGVFNQFPNDSDPVGYLNSRVTPITFDAYRELLNVYPQDHSFIE